MVMLIMQNTADSKVTNPNASMILSHHGIDFRRQSRGRVTNGVKGILKNKAWPM